MLLLTDLTVQLWELVKQYVSLLSLLLERKVHRQVVDKRRWKIGSHEHKLEPTKSEMLISCHCLPVC